MNPEPRAHEKTPAPWGRVGVLALSCFLVVACGPLRSREVDTIRYRKCSVTTLINYETRTTSHLLVCNGDPDSGQPKKVPHAAMSCEPGKPVQIVLYPGSRQFHFEEFIAVRYRFNGHAPVRSTWLWLPSTGSAGVVAPPSILKDFLAGITAREILAFQVGSLRGQVNFRKYALRALHDWRNRCAASGR